MKKEWDVKIDERMYHIELKNRKLIVDGTTLKLNSKLRKKMGLVQEEYEVPIGNKNALLIIRSMGTPQLVIDQRDCATGEEYVPVKTPKWAYVFMALHLPNFLNGAIGWLAAIWGITLTTSISGNAKFSLPVKLLLNVAVVVAMYAIVLSLAFMASGLLY